MRFLRGGRNPKRGSVGKLSLQKFGGAVTDRVELFATWVKSGEDWGSCEIYEERYHDALKRKKKIY